MGICHSDVKPKVKSNMNPNQQSSNSYSQDNLSIDVNNDKNFKTPSKIVSMEDRDTEFKKTEEIIKEKKKKEKNDNSHLESHSVSTTNQVKKHHKKTNTTKNTKADLNVTDINFKKKKKKKINKILDQTSIKQKKPESNFGRWDSFSNSYVMINDAINYKEYLSSAQNSKIDPNKQEEYKDLAEEFNKIKEIIDKKITLLENKDKELNLIQKHLDNILMPILPPPSKLKEFLTRSPNGIIDKLNIEGIEEINTKINGKKEQINYKKKNLHILCNKLKIISEVTSSCLCDKNIIISEVNKTLAKMSIDDYEIHLIHRGLKNIIDDTPLLKRQFNTLQPKILKLPSNDEKNDCRIEERDEIINLKKKLQKKLEKIENANKDLRSLEQKIHNPNNLKSEQKSVLDQVGKTIIKKIKKLDAKKDNGEKKIN